MSWRIVLVVVLVLTAIPVLPAIAAPPGNQYFERIWARTDQPVADQLVNRTWMWGPEAFTGVVQEGFRESPGGTRQVQYFDKSRMEISDTGEDPSSIWYVTNGLLVVEMMTGRMQSGLNTYENRQPANVNVAGDADDPLGATYRYFGFLTDMTPLPIGTVIHQVVSPGAAGNLFMYNERFNAYGVTAAYYAPETDHTVASVFWDFMNSTALVNEHGSMVTAPLFQNPFYATGIPVTEAYWAVVKVGGVDTDVLIQCFERRCLTYTPSNSSGWQVEAGNVGQHYYAWRYGLPPPGGSADMQPQLPEMIWTDAYLNPDAATTAIFRANGISTGPGVWRYEYRQSIAFAMPGLYSLSTVEVGSFNHDTRGFYSWLETSIVTSQLRANGRQLCGQMRAGFRDHESEIARRLAEFEAEFEEQALGFGAYAYWLFLVHPVTNFLYGHMPNYWDAYSGGFDWIAQDFAGAKFSNPQLTFVEFIEHRGGNLWGCS